MTRLQDNSGNTVSHPSLSPAFAVVEAGRDSACSPIPASRILAPELDYKPPGGGLRLAVIGFGKMGVLHSTILNLLSPGSVRIIVEKSRLLRFSTEL